MTSTRKPSRLMRAVLGAAIGILAIGGLTLSATASTAFFSTETSNGSFALESGVAGLQLSDAANANTCKLDFGQVNPGHSGADSCTLTNTGTVPLKLNLKSASDIVVTSPFGDPDPAKYTIQFGSLTPKAVNGFTLPVDLEITLDPGGFVNLDITLFVHSSVGNEGQKLKITGKYKFGGESF